MNPGLRAIATILGGIAAFIGFVWLSFWLDRTAVIPWFEAEALARKTGYQHAGQVLGYEGGFQDYRGMFRLETDAPTARRMAEYIAPPAYEHTTWDACMGGQGPWWWRPTDEAIGDCWTGGEFDTGWFRIHRADQSGVVTVLIVRN